MLMINFREEWFMICHISFFSVPRTAGHTIYSLCVSQTEAHILFV